MIPIKRLEKERSVGVVSSAANTGQNKMKKGRTTQRENVAAQYQKKTQGLIDKPINACQEPPKLAFPKKKSNESGAKAGVLLLSTVPQCGSDVPHKELC